MAKNFKAWPKGWPESLKYPELSVYHLLQQTAERIPNRIAIHFKGMELTYGELKDLADRFASALDDMGVCLGDIVAVNMFNCPQFAIAYYGTMRIGATFTPLSPHLTPREAKDQLNDCGAETLISLDETYPRIQSCVLETKVKRIIMTSMADVYNPIIAPLKSEKKTDFSDTIDFVFLLKRYGPFKKKVAIDAKEDIAHITYTGGTTGVSKGAMITHFNIVADVLQCKHWINGSGLEFKDGVIHEVFAPGVQPIQPKDKGITMVAIPWFHTMGINSFLNSEVYSGATMVVLPRFNARECLDDMVKYKVDRMGGSPPLYIALMNVPDFDQYDLSRIKVATSGAAPLPQAVMEKMLKAFSGVVCEAYGQSESTAAITFTPPNRNAIKLGSVGLPIFDTELKVVDVTTGEDLAPGAEGEICLKGPQVMKGYLNRPEATAEVLDKDGWLHTGDIGREDEDGYFYITDRKKDMILYKGYNIYPRELEEVIFEHPAVQQCGVVGKPDPDTGEYPVAFIQLKQGTSITAEEIMEYTNSQIAFYKKIREVHLVEVIPVNPSGKVLRRELRTILKDKDATA